MGDVDFAVHENILTNPSSEKLFLVHVLNHNHFARKFSEVSLLQHFVQQKKRIASLHASARMGDSFNV